MSEVVDLQREVCSCGLENPGVEHCAHFPLLCREYPVKHCADHDEFVPSCAGCQRSPGIAGSRLRAAWYGKLDTTLYGWYRHPDYEHSFRLAMVREDHAIVLDGYDNGRLSIILPDTEWAKGEWERAG